jgi:membrane protease YdiL (CAAX protease family)
MSTPTATPPPAPHSAIRRLVARHPVVAFLVMAYAVESAVALPPIRTHLAILPFDQPLWDSLGTILGVALPAFLVTAAMHGQDGVRHLARRCLRWRVGARWYLFSLLSVPIGALVAASAIFGLAPLHALVDKWLLLFTAVLPQLLILIVFFNLPEEIGWTGFLQARLQERHGPLKASVMVTVPFALWHLPSLMVDEGLGLAQLPLALGLLGILAIFQLFARVVIMWLYNNTNRSVLLVGLFHSSFNVTTQTFGSAFIPGPVGSGFLPASGVVAVAAVLIVVFTRGRLSYKPLLASPSEEAPHPPDAPLTQA